MDFAKDKIRTIDGYNCGIYESVPIGLLPTIYIAYSTEAGEPTEVTHGPLKARFLAGDAKVVAAMSKFASLAEAAYRALKLGDVAAFSVLMNENFDLRKSICDLSPTHCLMIETARQCGASAKFAGSGGAIVGVYPDETTFARLTVRLGEIGCKVIKPTVR